VPEPPEPPSPADPTPTALRSLAGDAADRAMPADAGTVDVAAITAGPETKHLRRGLGVAGWLSVAWLVFVVGGALLAPYLPLDDPKDSITAIVRKGPWAQAGTAPGHLLGGDGNGRDMLSRLLWGGRATLLIATTAVLIGFVIGGSLGLIAGYYRGRTETIVSGLFDVFLSIPAVILALALVTILRAPAATAGHATAGLDPETAIIIALGIVSIPVLGRITRASALTWSGREFVLAARAQGAKDRRILWREVLPNVLPAMVSIALLGIAVAIVAEGTLSILGASVEPDTPTWGNMIAQGRIALSIAPHIVFEPALMIFFTVLALNFLGDAIRARFDVREGGL
jgi:peptide/nickel transport system permease protein